jgi:Transcriptional regulators
MITIKDVAAYANVSKSTVSRVLSGNGYVGEATKKQVMQAVQDLGYKPNTIAKSLKVRRSGTIGVIIPSIQNLIFPDIVRGIEDTARKAGLTVILCNSDEDIEVEQAYIEKLCSMWIDGFIVSSMTKKSNHIKTLRQKGVPVVLTGRICDKGIDAVIIDNVQAAYDATAYLIRTGRRKIAIILGRSSITLYKERFQGYKKALEDYQIPFDERLVFTENAKNNNIYGEVKNFLEKEIALDAIFATTDEKAIVCMRAIRDMGYDIPNDIAVMGFDNVNLSSMLEPPLSTVSQPLYEMGDLAVKRLIEVIHYKNQEGCLPKPDIHILDVDLLVRKST